MTTLTQKLEALTKVRATVDGIDVAAVATEAADRIFDAEERLAELEAQLAEVRDELAGMTRSRDMYLDILATTQEAA